MSADPFRSLLAALKRGATIERVDYGGWRLFSVDGERGPRVSDGELDALRERGAIVRTDDRMSVIGETWGIAPASETEHGR